jgi:hypothetical protein
MDGTMPLRGLMLALFCIAASSAPLPPSGAFKTLGGPRFTRGIWETPGDATNSVFPPNWGMTNEKGLAFSWPGDDGQVVTLLGAFKSYECIYGGENAILDIICH